MRWIVDRFESGFAVCESQDGQGFRTVPASSLPPCREGELLEESDGVWTLLAEETQARRTQIHLRFARLRAARTPAPEYGKERHE